MTTSSAIWSRRYLLAGIGALAAWPTHAESDAATEMWAQYRAQWLVAPRIAYFDTAGFAPVTRGVLVAQYRAQEALNTDPAGFFASRYGSQPVQELCTQLASWLDCAPDEVACIRDATQGIALAASQLNLQAGDEVMVAAQLPLAVLNFWQQLAQHRQLSLKMLQFPMPLTSAAALQVVNQALSERTRALCLSHVQHLDGAIVPLQDLCNLARQRNIYTLIEGALSFGALNFSVRQLNCDVYATSLCHWLNGATPTGAVYIRRELHTTWPIDAVPGLPSGLATQGWPALQQRWPQSFVEQATQWQTLPAALTLQLNIGREVVQRRLQQLQTYARLRLQGNAQIELITSTEPGTYLHILSLRTRTHTPLQLTNWLTNNDNTVVGVASSADRSQSVLRISLHHCNSLDEIDRLVLGLERALRA